MKDALDIHRMLLERELRHEIIRLRRIVLSADELPDTLGLPCERCISVRMYDVDGRLTAVVVRAKETPPTLTLLSATGAREVRPASPDVVNVITDYAAGLVAPLLLPTGVQVLIDRRIVDDMDADDVVYTPTGDSGTALGIRTCDLVALSGARPVDLVTRKIELPRAPTATLPRVALPRPPLSKPLPEPLHGSRRHR